MENNRNIIETAISKLAIHEPREHVWKQLDQKLSEAPLYTALKNLGEYEPDQSVWKAIEIKNVSTNRTVIWWYAAAVVLFASTLFIWNSKTNQKSFISFSVEPIDSRLQVSQEVASDYQYEQLKSHCESETLICSSDDFKRLKKEFEELQTAAAQLRQAMGQYNSQPELMRQFSMLEQEKAEVLNKMAKMI